MHNVRKLSELSTLFPLVRIFLKLFLFETLCFYQQPKTSEKKRLFRWLSFRIEIGFTQCSTRFNGRFFSIAGNQPLQKTFSDRLASLLQGASPLRRAPVLRHRPRRDHLRDRLPQATREPAIVRGVVVRERRLSEIQQEWPSGVTIRNSRTIKVELAWAKWCAHSNTSHVEKSTRMSKWCSHWERSPVENSTRLAKVVIVALAAAQSRASSPTTSCYGTRAASASPTTSATMTYTMSVFRFVYVPDQFFDWSVFRFPFTQSLSF